jgi:hypothetical protein
LCCWPSLAAASGAGCSAARGDLRARRQVRPLLQPGRGHRRRVAWKQQTGKPYLEFEITNAAQREQAARRFAERGASPVVGIGFPQASAIEKVARDFPKLRFAIVDIGGRRCPTCRASSTASTKAASSSA